ncbi:Helicase conserved domain containing protein, partial [Reticulomyxa filosa]
TLSVPEQQVVEMDYDISKYTYMPSLFGDNQLIFAEEKDILIVKRCDYFTTLKKEIDNRLIGKCTNARRAVLVFFESKKQLTEFYDSSNFFAMKGNAIIMTEENTHEEKESLIKRATTSGQ